jgi:hypothetical protein
MYRICPVASSARGSFEASADVVSLHPWFTRSTPTPATSWLSPLPPSRPAHKTRREGANRNRGLSNEGAEPQIDRLIISVGVAKQKGRLPWEARGGCSRWAWCCSAWRRTSKARTAAAAAEATAGPPPRRLWWRPRRRRRWRPRRGVWPSVLLRGTSTQRGGRDARPRRLDGLWRRRHPRGRGARSVALSSSR